MISKILVPLAFSRFSRGILEYAAGLISHAVLFISSIQLSSHCYYVI
ncbi:MAG TPA: hypothetical protein VJ969_07180 [Desulfopila sp.]|nr:hypothetical protein [Desulfopila sp.]